MVFYTISDVQPERPSHPTRHPGMLVPPSRIETACNDFCADTQGREAVLLAMGVWEGLAMQPLRARWSNFQALHIVAQSKYGDRLHQGYINWLIYISMYIYMYIYIKIYIYIYYIASVVI